MKRYGSLFLAVLLAISLCGCGGNSVDLSTGRIDIGAIRFSLEDVTAAEKEGDLSYRFTLVPEEAWLTISVGTVAELDSQTAEAFAEMQRTTWLGRYPNRTDTGSATLTFAGMTLPCACYQTTQENSTLYHITASFVYSQNCYTLDYTSTSPESTGRDKLTAMLTKSAFLTTGELMSSQLITDQEAAEKEEHNRVLQDQSGVTAPLYRGQSGALERAKAYLESAAFSQQGLESQLIFEGYLASEASYAVRNCGADWNQQALRCAQSYLAASAFSYSGLQEQLKYEGFTDSQAKYGVDRCGASWYEQAVRSAKSYRTNVGLSGDDLIRQLEFEGFPPDQALHGAQESLH